MPDIPNIGTAFVLARSGALGEIQSSISVTFEEKAGLVPITIRGARGEIVSCELQAPQRVSFGKKIPPALIGSAVSLDLDDLVTTSHEPQVVSVALPFVMAGISRPQRARAYSHQR